MDDKSKNRNNIPRYHYIAIELASRIVSGEYKVGEIIYARSSIASQFGVSPETARRAICVLTDLDIVISEKGSGVTIKSRENAIKFINQQGKRQTIDSIKENIIQCISRQQEEITTLNSYLTDLISASEHLRSLNPFMPFEVTITSECPYIDKSYYELEFWQHTGATVLAIRRNNTLLKSPGPYIKLEKNDIVYFLPQDDYSEKVKNFLYPKK